MCRPALDVYDDMPREMRSYLRNNGWHFNKKAVEYAVSMMKKKNPATGKLEKIEPFTKDQVDDLLSRNGVQLDNATGLDYVYVANMVKADFMGSSIKDEQHLALHVKDVIDDPDAAEGTTMRRWYATMVAAGEPVEWDEIL